MSNPLTLREKIVDEINRPILIEANDAGECAGLLADRILAIVQAEHADALEADRQAASRFLGVDPSALDKVRELVEARRTVTVAFHAWLLCQPDEDLAKAYREKRSAENKIAAELGELLTKQVTK